jgi:hypothetical protein
MVERIGQWAQMVKPMLETNPPQPVPPLPDLDEQAEAQALVNALGSDKGSRDFRVVAECCPGHDCRSEGTRVQAKRSDGGRL